MVIAKFRSYLLTLFSSYESKKFRLNMKLPAVFVNAFLTANDAGGQGDGDQRLSPLRFGVGWGRTEKVWPPLVT